MPETGQGGHDEEVRNLAYRLWEEAGKPEGRSEEYWHRARAELDAAKHKVEQQSHDSFPASDPPSHSGITGPTGKGAH